MAQYGARFTHNYGTTDFDRLAPVSSLQDVFEYISMNTNQNYFEHHYNFDGLPNGVVLYATSCITESTTDDWTKPYAKSVVSGKRVTVQINTGPRPTSYLHYAFRSSIFADFSGVTDPVYGLSFPQSGVMSAFTSSNPMLCVKWKGTIGVGTGGEVFTAKSTLNWGTNPISLFVGFSGTDAFLAEAYNEGGKVGIRIKRSVNGWKGSPENGNPSLSSGTFYMVLFARWGGSIPKYGMVLKNSSGGATWATSEMPQIPYGWINGPYLKNAQKNDKIGLSEGQAVAYSTTPSSVRNKNMMFNTTEKRSLRSGGYGGTNVWMYYDKSIGRLSLANPRHRHVDGHYAYWSSFPRTDSGYPVRMPYLLVDDYF